MDASGDPSVTSKSNQPGTRSGNEPPEKVPSEPVAAGADATAGPEVQELEPPSARFIVQLFLLPALIVAVVVAIWLGFGKIASNERSVEEYIAGLRSQNARWRWTTAHELAVLLQTNKKLSSDPRLASELARLWEESHQRARSGERLSQEEMRYRGYLVRALGQLDNPVIVEPLRRAAVEDPEPEVRAAAVWELAEVVDRWRDEGVDPRLVKALLESSRDPEPQVRRVGAYALGVAGTEPCLQRLAQLLHDQDREVRYNAATGLARHGNLDGTAILEEMLQPLEVHQRTGYDEAMAAHISQEALKALRLALTQAPAASIDPLIDELTQWKESSLPSHRSLAQEILHLHQQSRIK
jgi:HEAT repeat protein